MKIIHTADNHLGASLVGLSSESAKARREELTDTFLRMLRYADGTGVDAIFICGDLFDSPTPPLGLIRQVIDGIASCKARVFYVTGNHDDGVVFPYTPDNFHRFERGIKTYVLGDVTVTGADYSYWQNSLLSGVSLGADTRNFLLLHGEVGQSLAGEKGKIDPSAIIGHGVDYLALGHIHNPPPARFFDGRGKYRYCGTLEGHGFDECGSKGFLLLDTDVGIRQTFVPFALRTYHDVTVDVAGANSAEDVENLAQRAIREIPQTDGVRLRLKGELPERLKGRLGRLSATLATRFFAFKMEDETSFAVDYAKYIEDKTIKGELVRLSLALPEEERGRVLSVAFRALAGEEPDV